MDVRNEAEFTALRRILELSRGTSSFTTAVCNSPALRETLFGALRSAGIPFLHATVVAGSLDPVEEVRAQIPSGSADPLFITGLDYLLAESSADSDRLLAVLNRSRERWRSAFPKQPLVFWLTTHTSVRLTTHAPDLRAWVSHELEFEAASLSGIRPDQPSLSRNFIWLSNLDAAAKRARLTDLDQRLSLDPPEPALFQEWARAWEEKITLLTMLGSSKEAEQTARSFLAAVEGSGTGFERWKGEAFSMLANILEARGELDEALRIRRDEVLPVFEQIGDLSSCAGTLGQIANILHTKGEIDEALRIRKDEVLPVFEQLGDARSRASTLSQIADILQARGEIDEALRIREEEVLPSFESLGDTHSRAVTLGRIADIYQERGELDEALRIRQEEELPVYLRLGHVRSRAVTLGKIADLLEARGDLDEALRIRQEEVLPEFERLGEARDHAITLGRVADIHQAKGNLNEALLIRKDRELPVYQKLGDVRAGAVTLGKIAGILRARGEFNEAIHIQKEEALPLFERIGDVRNLLVGRTNLALSLIMRGYPEDAAEILRLLRWSYQEALRLQFPEAGQIRRILLRTGIPEAELEEMSHVTQPSGTTSNG
jgi:tetratricopeptide (TPR) repeat protein